MQNQKIEQQVKIASSDLELLEDEKLKARAGGGLLKNLSLRGNAAMWAAVAAVAASVIGIFSVGIVVTPPAEAINRVVYWECKKHGYFIIEQQRPRHYLQSRGMCFANAGNIEVVIANVVEVSSGNNAGYIETNKGRVDFEKWTGFNFPDNGYGTVTILRIVIY